MKTFRVALPVLASALLLTAVGGTAQTRPALADYFTEIPPTVIDPSYVPRGLRSTENIDLNGDGYQDLVLLGIDPSGGTCCTQQPGRVFLGDGDGRFTPALLTLSRHATATASSRSSETPAA
jgi:hypothetical protein